MSPGIKRNHWHNKFDCLSVLPEADCFLTILKILFIFPFQIINELILKNLYSVFCVTGNRNFWNYTQHLDIKQRKSDLTWYKNNKSLEKEEEIHKVEPLTYLGKRKIKRSHILILFSMGNFHKQLSMPMALASGYINNTCYKPIVNPLMCVLYIIILSDI